MKALPPVFLPVRLSSSAALSAAAAAMLVPANLLPVMSMYTPGRPESETTIFGGIVTLYERGMLGLAVIVFTASILVPFAKIVGLAWLLLAARYGAGRQARRLTKLHGVLDFIGRWSMLDVFLVAVFSGLVQFGALATVEPRPGIAAFALAVVLTMVATQAFDPRWLWRRPAEVVEEVAA